MADMCTDRRFEIIAKAKEKLIHSTNITEEELKVADEFLYRCWQMGWLESEYDYEIKEYDVGNGKKLLVTYSNQGIARVTKQFIEQVMIPKFQKYEGEKLSDEIISKFF